MDDDAPDIVDIDAAEAELEQAKAVLGRYLENQVVTQAIWAALWSVATTSMRSSLITRELSMAFATNDAQAVTAAWLAFVEAHNDVVMALSDLSHLLPDTDDEEEPT